MKQKQEDEAKQPLKTSDEDRNSAAETWPQERRLPLGAHPATIQSLAKALSNLKDTAQRARFPAPVKNDAIDVPDSRITPAKLSEEELRKSMEYAVLHGATPMRTSGREASRLYNGAKEVL